MSEKLELVTDFGKLKAGDLVVVKRCGNCAGGTHRGLLTEMLPASDPRGRGIASWKTTDVCWRNRPVGIDAKTVAAGIVYLVDTGLEQTSESHAERPKKLEVTR